MKKITLLLFAICIIGCSKNKIEMPIDETIPFLVAKGSSAYFSNLDSPRKTKIIQNQTEMNDLITEVGSNYNGTKIINFTNYTVIAIIDEVRRYLGDTIDITKINKVENDLIVKVERLNLGLAAAISRPYHIIRIPKTSKSIIFDFNLDWNKLKPLAAILLRSF